MILQEYALVFMPNLVLDKRYLGLAIFHQIEIEKSNNKKVIEKTDQKTGENKYEKTKHNNSDFGLQNYES